MESACGDETYRLSACSGMSGAGSSRPSGTSRSGMSRSGMTGSGMLDTSSGMSGYPSYPGDIEAGLPFEQRKEKDHATCIIVVLLVIFAVVVAAVVIGINCCEDENGDISDTDVANRDAEVPPSGNTDEPD